MTTPDEVKRLVDDARKALRCLYIAVDATVADDVSRTVTAALDALAAQAAQPVAPTEPECARWNFDADESSLLVCRNEHEKGRPCEFEPMHPAEVLKLINELRAAVLEAHYRRTASPQAAQPVAPSIGLLMSMAIRFDHGLGMPGYYDSALFRQPGQPSHAQRVEATISTMRQLWEEVVGRGFYSPELEDKYRALASPQADTQPSEQAKAQE